MYLYISICTRMYVYMYTICVFDMRVPLVFPFQGSRKLGTADVSWTKVDGHLGLGFGGVTCVQTKNMLYV